MGKGKSKKPMFGRKKKAAKKGKFSLFSKDKAASGYDDSES